MSHGSHEPEEAYSLPTEKLAALLDSVAGPAACCRRRMTPDGGQLRLRRRRRRTTGCSGPAVLRQRQRQRRRRRGRGCAATTLPRRVHFFECGPAAASTLPLRRPPPPLRRVRRLHPPPLGVRLRVHAICRKSEASSASTGAAAAGRGGSAAACVAECKSGDGGDRAMEAGLYDDVSSFHLCLVV